MRILCVSEHFFPRVGGTVNYVHETCSALSALGHDVCLLVPATAAISPGGFPYRVLPLQAGYPNGGEPTRAQRYAFCSAANDYVVAAARNGEAEAVHALYGMYLAERLDVAAIRSAGVRTVITIHNVPPQECRLTWRESPLVSRAVDLARVQAVRWVNRRRLQSQAFDLYVTPSTPVERLLLRTVPGLSTAVIGHGPTTDLQRLISSIPPHARQRMDGGLQILTVGGWAPHKGQHLIPETAKFLRAGGLKFTWRVIGPDSRVRGYRTAVERLARDLGVHSNIRADGPLPTEAVAAAYAAADIYVQPSFEEGFCITALDAAAAGLPVIATHAGALPQIATASEGLTVAPSAGDIASAITRAGGQARRSAQTRLNQFSWQNAARSLAALYRRS